MKIKFILSSLITTLFISACTDNDTKTPIDTGDTKKVFLQINAGKQNTLRSDEPSASGTTAEMYSAIIYFIDGQADPVIYEVFTVGTNADVTIDEIEAGYEFEDIPSSVTQVFVVGNYNSIDGSGNGPSFPETTGNRLSTVQNVLLNIEQITYPALADGTPVTEPLSLLCGRAAVQDYLSNPDDWNGDAELTDEDMYANVTISPLTSRLEIVQMTYTGDFQSFTLEGIYINYFYQEGPLSLDFSDYGPINKGSTVANYTAASYSPYPSLFDTLNRAITPAGGTATILPVNGTWAYQVFGNSSPVPHIILKFTDVINGAGTDLGDRYITVKGYRSSGVEVGTFERNTIYKISNLAFTDSDFDLLPETEEINIWVHVEVAPWITLQVTPIL